MDCPVCENSAMIVLELDESEVDYCFGCNGIWLDAGELELLLDGSEQAEHLLASFRIDKAGSEKIHKCPICLKKMRKISVGPPDQFLLIDKCPKAHGLWFDKGELQDILAVGNFDKEQKIQKLLADMFESKEPL